MQWNVISNFLHEPFEALATVLLSDKQLKHIFCYVPSCLLVKYCIITHHVNPIIFFLSKQERSSMFIPHRTNSLLHAPGVLVQVWADWLSGNGCVVEYIELLATT